MISDEETEAMLNRAPNTYARVLAMPTAQWEAFLKCHEERMRKEE